MTLRTSLNTAAALLLTVAAASCKGVDDDRIPLSPVYIDLGSQGLWDSYGVHSLGNSRRFIKDTTPSQPAGFFYSAASYTGFGGVLLVTDIVNTPLAYDLACPVERQRNVRVVYNPDDLRVHCPECGSVYDVSEFYGSPVSGPAYERKFGLRRYTVVPAIGTGYIIRP